MAHSKKNNKPTETVTEKCPVVDLLNTTKTVVLKMFKELKPEKVMKTMLNKIKTSIKR